jgi:hypothetical protein
VCSNTRKAMSAACNNNFECSSGACSGGKCG